MPPRGRLERQPVDQRPVAVTLHQPLGLDDQVAQPRARRDGDLQPLDPLGVRRVDHRLVGLQPRLALGLPRARREPHPLELALQRALAGLVGLLLLGQARLLLLQPGGVVALPRDAGAAVQLEDPAGRVVEEVPVVGDRHHRARVLLQEALQPRHRLGVEVVGGLVQQQHGGLGQQQAAQRDPPPLTAGDLGDVGIARWHPEGVHGQLHRAVEVPGVHGVDLVLQARLLLEELLHLIVVQRLAQLAAHLLEAREQGARLRHAVLDVGRARPWWDRATGSCGR